jgi:hypothetical protein
LTSAQAVSSSCWTFSQSKGIEKQFNEIILKNIPNLGKQIDIKVQEAFRIPNRHNQKKKFFPYDIIDKMSRVQKKERILKMQEISAKVPTMADLSE